MKCLKVMVQSLAQIRSTDELEVRCEPALLVCFRRSEERAG